MNVTCADCASIFRVDPARVPRAGVRARCSVCGAIIAVAAPAVSGPAVSAPAAPAVADPVVAQPVVAQPVVAVRADGRVIAAEPPVTRARDAEAFPSGGVPTPESGAAAIRVGPRITPRTEPGRAPGEERSASQGPLQVPLQTAPAAPAAESTRAPLQAASGAAPAARRVNPFLANDPSQKARRLARALVSDLVAYQPQKREEGLRAGTLKELFRDEIRKSWEEYVAQVGAPIAESTTHFQDALNDVLAGGRKVF